MSTNLELEPRTFHLGATLCSLSSMQSGDQVMNDWMHPFLALLIFSGVDLEPIMKYLWNCGGPTQRILYLISLRALVLRETDNRIDRAAGIQSIKVLQKAFGSYRTNHNIVLLSSTNENARIVILISYNGKYVFSYIFQESQFQ